MERTPTPRRAGSLRMFDGAFGSTLPGRIGSLLVLAGLVLMGYSAAAYFGIVPGGYTTLPEPVALSTSGQRSAHLEADVDTQPAMPLAPEVVPDADLVPAPAATVGASLPASAPIATEPVAPPADARQEQALPAAIKLQPADSDDRREAALRPRPGTPVRLQLPSIKVDTEVKPAGLVSGPDGELEWETLPFVAAHYALLGPVGAPGNAVISGHVVTLQMGNVFRDLYQVELGEPIEVYTANSHFTYQVVEIKLVKPDQVEVLAPTEDARLTVITCGGTFDPRTRTFSDRLVVVGKLVGGERL